MRRTSARRRSSSLAKNRPFVPAQAKKKIPDDGQIRIGHGQQGIAICPKCRAWVSLRKLNRGTDPEWVPAGSVVMSNHAVGGGKVSWKRGDVLCLGAGTPPEMAPITEFEELDETPAKAKPTKGGGNRGCHCQTPEFGLPGQEWICGCGAKWSAFQPSVRKFVPIQWERVHRAGERY